jgi:tetratricopeptide (TPR) repeat protein
MGRLVATLAALALLGATVPVLAETVQRAAAPVGSVIQRKSGEEVFFIDLPPWRSVELNQDLLPGDILRTNEGHLAILFADNTQMRVARNSTLVIKQIGNAADTVLGLEAGEIWVRAEAGGEGLTVETPAAAAAVRGTEWSLRVDGAKTSMIVLEGTVELANPQGSVSVTRGEGAVAYIGQAPTKTVIVDPDDREQMLFYLSVRNAFNFMPASPLSSPDMRRQRSRIAAIPEQARSAEDWLTLAEVSLSYDGQQAALDAAAHAREFRLSASQKTRLDLIDALVAGAQNRYAEAAQLFARAAPRLDDRRRAIALYGGYFARSLANPDRLERPPVISGGGPYAAIAEAWATGFLKDIPSAVDVLKRAQQRYPDDPTLPAIHAQVALLMDYRKQAKEAIERSLAIDPDDPTALEARANYKAGFESDLEGALADLERAVAIAPGSTTVWNALGLVQSARHAEREAEAALKRSIELDPYDPVSYANLAIFYLDQDRVAEAKVLIDKALEVDPSFSFGLVARGRYYMQTGEMEKGIQDLLAGSAANPAYSQGQLLLGAGYYESGEKEPAEQSIENADRLDPNDPITTNFETAIAIDDYDSDRAIASAQETLRRAQARGGDYASLSANREEGSLVNNAFRLQGLDAWGRYYGDVFFDPFSATGYVDQSLAGSVDPFVVDLMPNGSVLTDPEANNSTFSSLFQGLMFDPLMLSGRSRTANLFRRPFFESSIGAGFTNHGPDDWAPTWSGELQGYQSTPIPWSVYGQFSADRSEDFRTDTAAGFVEPTSQFDLQFKNVIGTGYITAKPTPYDRVVAFANFQQNEPDLLDGVQVISPPVFVVYDIPDSSIPGGLVVPALVSGGTYDRTVDDKTATAGVGWSHTFGYRNILNAAVFASGFERSSQESGVLVSDAEVFGVVVPAGTVTNIDAQTELKSYTAAVNHTYGVGDVTFRYGIEGGTLSSQSSTLTTETLVIGGVAFPLVPTTENLELDLTIGRAYVDALYEITPDLKVEAAAFGTYMEGDTISIDRFEPRVGIAWAPVDGHWFRAGFMRESSSTATPTLSPIGVVALQSNQVPLGLDGYSDTFIARWDAEWTSHLFTSVDYQHQDLTNISITNPGLIDTIDLTDARLDRVSATANVWLEHGLGAFGTIAWSESENEMPGFSGSIPFIPELTGRVGVTRVNEANVKVTFAGTYVGERTDDLAGTNLDDFWTADAFLTWEPFNKRFELQLAGYNLFDQEFDLATSVPGWGRSFAGSLKIRF